MALFDWFGKKKDDGPPARNDRQRCWESRDAYFACLDKADVLIPGKEENRCASQLKEYEGNCAKSWIDYFNQRRVIEEKRKGLMTIANNQAAEARAKAR